MLTSNRADALERTHVRDEQNNRPLSIIIDSEFTEPAFRLISYLNLLIGQEKYVPWSIDVFLQENVHFLSQSWAHGKVCTSILCHPLFQFSLQMIPKILVWTAEMFYKQKCELDCSFERCKRTSLLVCDEDFVYDKLDRPILTFCKYVFRAWPVQLASFPHMN